MNPEALDAAFPGLFVRRQGRGLLYLALALVVGIGGLAISLYLLTLMTPDGLTAGEVVKFLLVLGVFVVITGYLVHFGLANTNPWRHSGRALKLLQIKELHDSGAFHADEEMDLAKVTLDYSEVSIFNMLGVFKAINWSEYPDNFRAAQKRLREQVEYLTKQGVFE